MKDTSKFVIVFVFCLNLLSCKTTKSSESISIKGNVNIVADKLDENIKSGGIVQGYVYSKLDNKYIDGAIIEVDETKYHTNSEGFFNVRVKSGTHKISAIFIGHTSIKVNDIKVLEKHNLDIRFELGSHIIICK